MTEILKTWLKHCHINQYLSHYPIKISMTKFIPYWNCHIIQFVPLSDVTLSDVHSICSCFQRLLVGQSEWPGTNISTCAKLTILQMVSGLFWAVHLTCVLAKGQVCRRSGVGGMNGRGWKMSFLDDEHLLCRTLLWSQEYGKTWPKYLHSYTSHKRGCLRNVGHFLPAFYHRGRGVLIHQKDDHDRIP